MRGESERQATLMLGLTPDGFVARDHPLRRIKQQGAQLCYVGHVLTENRHGPAVDVEPTEADGRARSGAGDAGVPPDRMRRRVREEAVDRPDLLDPTVVATAQLEHEDDGGRLPAEVQRRGLPQWRPQAWPEF